MDKIKCIDCGKILTGHNNPKRCNSCAKKGILNPIYNKSSDMKGKTHSLEARRKISEKQIGRIPWNKGKKLPSSWNKGKSSWSKGKHFSKEHRDKLRQANLNTWSSEDKRKEHSLRQKGKSIPIEQRIKMSKARKGIYCKEKHPNWKGGLSPLHELIRHSDENKSWIRKVFIRDNFTCRECGLRNTFIEAHHIIPFNLILKSFLSIYSQFSPIEDKETLARLAISYEPFWDINNGQTLCKKCHRAKKSLGVNKC